MSRSATFDYWDEELAVGEGGWNSLGVGELVEVSYEDEVYKPAFLKVTISNASAAGGIAFTGIAHDGASPIIITNAAHGLDTGDRIGVSSENTGQIESKIYGIEKINDNTFYIKHFDEDPRTGEKMLGGNSARITGDGTSGSGTLTYAPVGKYGIETTSIADADFYMGQKVMLWHFQEGFNPTQFSHDGNASSLSITYNAHPFEDGEIVQVVDETSGTVIDGAYKVANESTNAFELVKINNDVPVVGNGTAGKLKLYFIKKSEGFPLFLGGISDLQESWRPGYGKVIELTAKDFFQNLDNEPTQEILKEISSGGEKMGADPRMGLTIPPLVYMHEAGSQDKYSDVVAAISNDFAEGDSEIYTDNTVQGSTAFTSGAEKFEDSSFSLTADELASTNFKKDLSDSKKPVLRVMQQFGMQDRHVSVSGNGSNKIYVAGVSPPAITHINHGLEENDLISVTNDRATTVGNPVKIPQQVPNGIYRVKSVTANVFKLHTLNGDAATATATNGMIDWEGMEDGNFGYDFFLDSGMYGQPAVTGYKIAGSATEYEARPAINYFKRGYRQFRPDATSLRFEYPQVPNTEEDGQTRIMREDAKFTIGDEEVITKVNLKAVIEDDADQVGISNSLELLRIKKIACKDNVSSITTVAGRSVYAGRWLGDFHWGRHDSFVAKTAGDDILHNLNDQPMLYQNDGTTTLGADDASTWFPADSLIGGGSARGDTSELDILNRVILTDIGGYTSGKLGATISKVSGYSGLSELGIRGRSIQDGPGTAPSGGLGISVATTAVCDMDLIKSVQNVNRERLYGSSDIVSTSGAGGTGSAYLLVTKTGHGLQTGTWIKATEGSILSGSYWMNYYRVVYVNDNTFLLTRLPYEAYQGISSGLPSQEDIYAEANQIASGAGSLTKYRIAYNIFNGVARVQYQTMNTRTETEFTENFVLVSDRIKTDTPYAGVEVYAIDSRVSSDTTLVGLPYGYATMPDTTNYGTTLEQRGTLPVPVTFKKGDKLSETRFLFHDNASSAVDGHHLFKNTQAIISESVVGDKNRSKTEILTYSLNGNDYNEVRRTAAAMLSRSSRDLIRGTLNIMQYPFIKLTGEAQSGTSAASLVHNLTTSATSYGGRPGMLVHKTDSLDGDVQSGLLAEDITTTTITGTLTPPYSWVQGSYYRMYVHLRAGHSVRVSDTLNSIGSNMIATKIAWKEGPGTSSTTITVIGFKDTGTGFAVNPLGRLKGNEQDNSKVNRPQNIGSKGAPQTTCVFTPG